MVNHTKNFKFDSWHPRTARAAELISPLKVTNVYEYGCGDGRLRKLLPGHMYTGYDMNTFADCYVDLNEMFPIPGTPKNLCAAVCLGFLEYVDRVDMFIDLLAGCHGHVICSYMDKTHSFNHEGRIIPGYSSIVQRLSCHYKRVDWVSIALEQPIFHAHEAIR